jgi:hypothetical protein
MPELHRLLLSGSREAGCQIIGGRPWPKWELFCDNHYEQQQGNMSNLGWGTQCVCVCVSVGETMTIKSGHANKLANNAVILLISLWMNRLKPITMAAWSKAWTVFARWNAGIVGSNPTQGMHICVRLFCVCVVLSVGSGLARGWSPVQGVLSTVNRIKKPKKRPRSNKRTVEP